MTTDAVTAYATSAQRRRRLRRRALRRYEVVVWAAVALVLVGLAVVLTRPEPDDGIRPVGAAPSGPVGCAFDPCPGQRYAGSPTRVRIPAIGVDSGLEFLALDGQRQLQPPKDYQVAGWYSGGVAPGDAGAAVIAGHVDSERGPAVFFELTRMRAGDVIEVDRGGQTVRFRVTGVEQYPKDAFPSERVYGPTPGPELRVITCGGSFDRGRGSYRDNIVVYAIQA